MIFRDQLIYKRDWLHLCEIFLHPSNIELSRYPLHKGVVIFGDPVSCFYVISAPEAGYSFAVIGFLCDPVAYICSAYSVCSCCSWPEDPSTVQLESEQQQQQQHLKSKNEATERLQRKQAELQKFIQQHYGKSQQALNASIPVADFGQGRPPTDSVAPQGVFKLEDGKNDGG
jgi:hypothetical protein